MIINLGVIGKVVDDKGYSFSRLIDNSDNSCETIIQHKIQTNVTPLTIEIARSKKLIQEETEEIQEYYKKLELTRLIEDEKGKQIYPNENLYMARLIVEGYFKEDIRLDEKRAIIRCVLFGCDSLKKGDKRNCAYLSTLMHDMEKIGLSEKEIYGMIINLGINESVLDVKGFSYASLLNNTYNARKNIEQYREKIQTKVSPETIQKASTKKFKKIKRKALLNPSLLGPEGTKICDDVEANYERLREEKANRRVVGGVSLSGN